MQKFPPAPNGFRIRQQLSSGMSKHAYRASWENHVHDVALMKMQNDDNASELMQEVVALMGLQKHEFSSYVANIHGVFKSADGTWYLAEELLSSPLDNIKPVSDMAQFARIARDVCRGLCCLHDNGKIHRDIKLDNLGLDQTGKAKVFDLGLLTSEPKDVRGAFFTRAPELLASNKSATTAAQYTFAADVWSCGATLFALRIGRYPFLSEGDISQRKKIGQAVAAGEDHAVARRDDYDTNLFERCFTPAKAEIVYRQISSSMWPPAAKILRSMLALQSPDRPRIRELEIAWGALYTGLVQPVAGVADAFLTLKTQISAYTSGSIDLSPDDLNRTSAMVEQRYSGAQREELLVLLIAARNARQDA
jgi:serine/threonine protein kinase